MLNYESPLWNNLSISADNQPLDQQQQLVDLRAQSCSSHHGECMKKRATKSMKTKVNTGLMSSEVQLQLGRGVNLEITCCWLHAQEKCPRRPGGEKKTSPGEAWSLQEWDYKEKPVSLGL